MYASINIDFVTLYVQQLYYETAVVIHAHTHTRTHFFVVVFLQYEKCLFSHSFLLFLSFFSFFSSLLLFFSFFLIISTYFNFIPCFPFLFSFLLHFFAIYFIYIFFSSFLFIFYALFFSFFLPCVIQCLVSESIVVDASRVYYHVKRRSPSPRSTTDWRVRTSTVLMEIPYNCLEYKLNTSLKVAEFAFISCNKPKIMCQPLNLTALTKIRQLFRIETQDTTQRPTETLRQECRFTY